MHGFGEFESAVDAERALVVALDVEDHPVEAALLHVPQPMCREPIDLVPPAWSTGHLPLSDDAIVLGTRASQMKRHDTSKDFVFDLSAMADGAGPDKRVVVGQCEMGRR